MPSVFSRNSILMGCVEYFCLVCETQLRSDEDAIQHLANPIHKRNLDTTSFLDKFKEDRVRKVKKGYYCEYCNLFMRTAAKVGPHVAEMKHVENKSSQPLRKEGNCVMAFDKVLISSNAWHGLIDDTCAVCDVEFDNAQIHKTEKSHALNLVLIDVEIGAGYNIYRKVDESTFQCLTCNLVCAQNTMAAHFEDAEHKKLYQLCCKTATDKINGKQETPEPEQKKDDKEGKPTEKEIDKTVMTETAKSAETIQKAAVKEPATGEPKKSENEPNMSNSNTSDEQATNGALKKTNVTEKKLNKGPKDALGKTDKEICDALNAVDFIARDSAGRQWCILCDWAMDDPTIRLHVQTRHHQTLLKMHKERAQKGQVTCEPETNGEAVEDVNADKILESVDEFQRNDIMLDLVNCSAYCRKCSKCIDYDFDVITDHIDKHKKKQDSKEEDKTETVKEITALPTGSEEKTSTTSLFTSVVSKDGATAKEDNESESRASSVTSTRDEAEIEAFAKEHDLVYTKDKNNAFCRVCVTKIPPTIRNMREHVHGANHKSKATKTAVKKAVKPAVKQRTMTPSHVFIKHIASVRNMISRDIIVNDKYVVNLMSFWFITNNGGKLRCQACEVNVPESGVYGHMDNPRHEKAMSDALVASSEESEFVREIRRNLFHCGFCNQLEVTWETMELHLKTTAHNEAKNAASWRRMEYMPTVAQSRASKQNDFALMSRMIMERMHGAD